MIVKGRLCMNRERAVVYELTAFARTISYRRVCATHIDRKKNPTISRRTVHIASAYRVAASFACQIASTPPEGLRVVLAHDGDGGGAVLEHPLIVARHEGDDSEGVRAS